MGCDEFKCATGSVKRGSRIWVGSSRDRQGAHGTLLAKLGGRERHAEMSEGGFQQLQVTQVMKRFSGSKPLFLQKTCTESACSYRNRHRTQVLSLRSGATRERKIIPLPARLAHEPLANTRTCCGDSVTSSYGNVLRELALMAEGHRH